MGLWGRWSRTLTRPFYELKLVDTMSAASECPPEVALLGYGSASDRVHPRQGVEARLRLLEDREEFAV